MTIAGVDVASFQGTPGQWNSAAGNYEWAAVKLTEFGPGNSEYIDPDAAADWSALKSAGKGRVAYLFGHPSVSASGTVSFFAAELANLGLEDGDGIALDLETTDGASPATVAAWGLSVLRQLRSRYDRIPLLYTFIDFAQEGCCAGLGGYPLWIADPSSPAGSPTVPAPWKTWAVHQYDISGDIDRDVAKYGSLTEMQAALGKQTPPPPALRLLEDPMNIAPGSTNVIMALPDGTVKIKIGYPIAAPAASVQVDFPDGTTSTVAPYWGGAVAVESGTNNQVRISVLTATVDISVVASE